MWIFEIAQLLYRKFGGIEGATRDIKNLARPFELLINFTLIMLVIGLFFSTYPFGFEFLPQWDLSGINLVLAILLNILHIFIWTKPSVLLKLAGVAFIGSKIDSDKGFTDYVGIIKKAISAFMLYITMFLIMAAVVPFRNHPSSIISVIAGSFGFYWLYVRDKENLSYVASVLLWAIHKLPFMLIVGSLLALIPEAYFLTIENAIGFNPHPSKLLRLTMPQRIEAEISAIAANLKKQEYEELLMQITAYRKRQDGGDYLTELELAEYQSLILKLQGLNAKYAKSTISSEPITKKEKPIHYYYKVDPLLVRKVKGKSFRLLDFTELVREEQLKLGDRLAFIPDSIFFEYAISRKSSDEVKLMTGSYYKTYSQEDVGLGDWRVALPQGEELTFEVQRQYVSNCTSDGYCLKFERTITGNGSKEVIALKPGQEVKSGDSFDFWPLSGNFKYEWSLHSDKWKTGTGNQTDQLSMFSSNNSLNDPLFSPGNYILVRMEHGKRLRVRVSGRFQESQYAGQVLPQMHFGSN
ncbi:hypothetical protein ISS03_04645 [Patescibacteria group bacterium]|nr:hypothetical protein [Patescibacteria group bacterium]